MDGIAPQARMPWRGVEDTCLFNIYLTLYSAIPLFIDMNAFDMNAFRVLWDHRYPHPRTLVSYRGLAGALSEVPNIYI
jgi:hypothetical protein